MLRHSFCALAFFAACAAPTVALAAAQQARLPQQAAAPQCSRELASVDRSFADAMLDLRRGDAPEAKCGVWRRQIEVMKKASDVFARCTADEAREINLSQMEGSIADFRALIDEAKCPGGTQ